MMKSIKNNKIKSREDWRLSIYILNYFTQQLYSNIIYFSQLVMIMGMNTICCVLYIVQIHCVNTVIL